ncbi:hypothetical protein Tco_0935777 [Tanacetum coccineum]
MTGYTTPPIILLSNKLLTVTNLTTLVSFKLDVDKLNYSSWVNFFKNLCKGFEELKHILGSPDESSMSTPVPPTPKWLNIESIILSLIFMTLSETLQAPIVELWSLKLGDLSSDAYFCKIESITIILTSLESPFINDDVVTNSLEGLPDKNENVFEIIVYREPFLDLKAVPLMLTAEEIRLNSRSQALRIDSSSSSSTVPLAESGMPSSNMGYHVHIGPLQPTSSGPRVVYHARPVGPPGFPAQPADYAQPLHGTVLPSALSHGLMLAQQLGKHVRLPFVRSNTFAKSCFKTVHSDL